MAKPTKYAVLDVDGTLCPGALGVTLLQALMERGLCDLEAATAVLETLAAFGRGDIDFATMATRAYTAYARALAGRETAAIASVAASVWSQRRPALFEFVPELLACLRERGYATMLISGSPIEMVSLVAETLAIDEAHGAVFARAAGRYTGTVDLDSGAPGQKAVIFAAATADRAVDLERSFALGDSLTDLALFERVGLPLPFEPSAELTAIAHARGWTTATRASVVARCRALLDAPAPHNQTSPPC